MGTDAPNLHRLKDQKLMSTQGRKQPRASLSDSNFCPCRQSESPRCGSSCSVPNTFKSVFQGLCLRDKRTKWPLLGKHQCLLLEGQLFGQASQTPFKIFISHIRVPWIQFQLQLLIPIFHYCESWEASGDGPCGCIPAIHMGDLAWLPSSQFCPFAVPIIGVFGEQTWGRGISWSFKQVNKWVLVSCFGGLLIDIC